MIDLSDGPPMAMGRKAARRVLRGAFVRAIELDAAEVQGEKPGEPTSLGRRLAYRRLSVGSRLDDRGRPAAISVTSGRRGRLREMGERGLCRDLGYPQVQAYAGAVLGTQAKPRGARLRPR